MSAVPELSDELSDLGEAIGLIDGGALNASWFNNPLDDLGSILSNSDQRSALLRLLDALLPPRPPDGVPASGKWHPLLGDMPDGNAYLTVLEDAGGVTFGVAGHYGTPVLVGNVSAQISTTLPLVRAGTTVEAIAGSPAAPLQLHVRVNLGWQRPADPIGLAAMRFDIAIDSGGVGFSLTLEQLQLDDSAACDVELDPSNLGEQSLQLVLGLVKRVLQDVLAAAGAEAKAVKDHLLPLLGLGDDNIAPLPLAELGRDPAALQKWFESLLDASGGPPAVIRWLGHLAGLLGVAGAAPAGSGTASDPWRVVFVPFSGVDGLALTISRRDNLLCFGILASVVPGLPSSPRIQATATIAAIALTGTARASVLPDASVTLNLPGDASTSLIGAGPLTIQALAAGVAWDGAKLHPRLELQGVNLDGVAYPTIDLSSAQGVAQAGTNVVKTQLDNALGHGAGSHLAALIGLNPAPADPTYFAQLFSNPARAIGLMHRALLVSGNWSAMLGEIAGLIGLPGGTSGSGTAADPWRVDIATAGPVTVSLAAWNAAANAAADPQLLRLGLAASAAAGSVSARWLAELLAFDLPAAGGGKVGVLAGQHLVFRVSPGPGYTSPDQLSFQVGSIEARADWTPGSKLTWQAGLANLSVTVDGTTIQVPKLGFPATIDVADPVASAASLGVALADLESLLKLLIARGCGAWGDVQGYVAGALAGVHGRLVGLQDDWPTLADPSGPGSLLANPGPALRQWLDRITTGVSADGSPFLPQLLPWLGSFVSGSIQDAVDPSFSGLPPLAGDGTYESPWRLPLGADSAAPRLVAWLEPEGPPKNWASALPAAAMAATGIGGLTPALRSLSSFHGGLAAAIAGVSDTVLGANLSALAQHLATSDGVVPLSAQTPSGGQWTAGTTADTSHDKAPSSAGVISQVLAQIDAWAGGAGAARCVLYVGPSFCDSKAWDALLASPARNGTIDPGATFSLRQSGVDPLTISLASVTAVADHYTAELQDDGSGDASKIAAQIGRVVARLGELRPGVKVTLVAHSTAGLGARAYTAANAGAVRGLVTIATPHLGASLPFLSDDAVGGAVRIAQGLLASMPASTVKDALAHLVFALDGYAPPQKAGLLPTAQPYPAASFLGTGATDTGAIPALAIGCQLAGALQDVLKTTTAAIATAAGASARATPTHLCFGVAAALDMGAAQPGQVTVDARVRANLVRIALRNGVVAPARPAQALRVEIALDRPGGWLVGGPGPRGASGDPLRDVRLRRATIGIEAVLGSGSTLQATPFAQLVQCGVRGQMSDLNGLADSIAGPLLGALTTTMSVPPPASASAAGSLLAALQALGLAVPDPAGGYGFAADALAALQADAIGFLAPRMQAALASVQGLAGIAGPPSGPWQLTLGALPVTLTVQSAPWRIGVATTGQGLSLGGDAALSFAGSLALPALTPSLDAAVSIGRLSLGYSQATGQLSVAAPPWLESLLLYPPPAASDLTARLNDALPRLLFSSAAGSLLEALLGPDIRQVGPIDLFLQDAGGFLQKSPGMSSPGGGFDGVKINALLEQVGSLAGFGAGPGLALPGGLTLSASGAGSDASPLQLQLATSAPIAGVLGFTLSATVDRLRHVSPGGSLSLAVPLGGTWPDVTVEFGVDASGVSLKATPNGVAPIQLLPTFSGLGALLGAAEALLPRALQAVVDALKNPGPAPAWLDPILQVADAAGIYDSVHGFGGHASDLAALAQGNLAALTDSTHRANIAGKLATLLNGVGLPGSIAASGPAVTWSLPAGGGQVGITAGWDGTGPLARVFVQDMKPAGGPVRLTLAAGYAAGQVVCAAEAGFSLASSLGIQVEPRISTAIDTGGGFRLRLLPLAVGGLSPSEGPIEVVIAPVPAVNTSAGSPEQFVTQVALPLAVQAAYAAARGELGTSLWNGGPTLRDALKYAQLIDNADALVAPLPQLPAMVAGLLGGIASNLSIAKIDITPNLHLQIAAEGSQLGIRLHGQQDFESGDYKLSLRFGAPSNWSPPQPGPGNGKADDGIVLWLLDTAGGIAIKPELLVAGLGFGIAGKDKPLIDTSYLRVGGIVGYFFFDLTTMPALSIDSVGAGIDLTDFGIPLGMATGGNLGGDNPVAANLLKSDGGSAAAPGDTQPVNPSADVQFWYWGGTKGDAQLHVRVGGEDSAIWIGVHAGFGPLYIDQVGIKFDDQRAGLLIDGGVSVAGFTAQVDQLSILVPYRDAGDPSKWTLDLQGLAVGYSNPGVTISGGLVKFDGPPVEYDGMLLVKISEIGIVAIGSYATPDDGGQRYTSVAIFAGVFVPINIAPYVEIDALGLGVGYNRQIVVPDDMSKIPDFALVKALDHPEDFANNPMGTLKDFSAQFPARRGSFWLAVGVRGTVFEVVDLTAVLYVALDRGVEVGLLGLASLIEPDDDFTIVSVELALKARFSSAEALFSMQAQLTDNSWLLSKDCQLTGGFAFFVWFGKSQVLLTLGGYHPAFKPLPEYPVVPRLGYHWNLFGVIQIKGETYFALTNTCVMAGTRLEATYGPDCIQVWFTAYLDILVSWDPFFYDLAVGIAVGARVRIQVCFIGCVDIDISISVGASLQVQGPPLHGIAQIDLGVCSVTIPFGPDPCGELPSLQWNDFSIKYLLSGDPNGSAFQAHVAEGLLPADPPGGQIAPGTADAPWKIAAEWTFLTGSTAPAKGYAFQTDDAGDAASGIGRFDQLASVYDFDIAPMGKDHCAVGSLHRVVIEKWDAGSQTASALDHPLDPNRIQVTTVINQVSEATYHYFGASPPPAASNTLPALAGLRIAGFAESRNPSQPIDIRHLVDESNSRPLPFATLNVTVIAQLVGFGTAADALTSYAAKADTPTLLGAAGRILAGGDGIFADARAATGIPRAGLDPLAAGALSRQRSAPPVVTPLSTGLTLKAVGQALPVAVAASPVATPLLLQAPRLRAVMRAATVPTGAIPVRTRTTVSAPATKALRRGAAAPAALPRFTAPRPADALGARLIRVPAPGTPAPTARAARGRTVLNAQLGHAIGPRHQADLDHAAASLRNEGVAVPAGSTHLWDIPPGPSRLLQLDGAAARVTLLSRNGYVLSDLEFVDCAARVVALPDLCAMVAIACLGEIPGVASSPLAAAPGAMGVASLNFARAGSAMAAGWQTSSEVQQLNPSTFLARGAVLEVSGRTLVNLRRQPAQHGMVRLAGLLSSQVGWSTRLPGQATTLAVALDVVDSSADDRGDLALAVDGLVASSAPLLVAGGRRKLWLYDLGPGATGVRPTDFTVAVASQKGSLVAGVMAMGGSARQWAVRLNGQVPPVLVADGPITPYGEVRVRLKVRAPKKAPAGVAA